jgi:hypothetical protein
MITPFDEVAEMIGIPCDECDGGAIIILDMVGNVEKLSCKCVNTENEYFPFDEFGECD